MSGNYTVMTELTGEAKVLAEAAKAASRNAVAQAFAAGLSIAVAKNGKPVRIAPDGAATGEVAVREAKPESGAKVIDMAMEVRYYPVPVPFRRHDSPDWPGGLCAGRCLSRRSESRQRKPALSPVFRLLSFAAPWTGRRIRAISCAA